MTPITIETFRGDRFHEVLRFTNKDMADQYAVQQAPNEVAVLASQIEVETLPTADLISVFNKISSKPVNKFSDRKNAIRRVLAAIDELPPSDDKVEPLVVKTAPAPVEVTQEEVVQAAVETGALKPADLPTEVARDDKPTRVTKKPLKEKQGILQGIIDATREKAAQTRRKERGINLKPHPAKQCYPARAGSKQAAFIDLLSHVSGATMSILIDAMSKGGKPWTEASVKTGLNWDVHTVKGYGVRTEFHNGESLWRLGHYDDALGLGWDVDTHADETKDDVVEAARKATGYDATHVMSVYFLVLPTGMDDPHPHTAVKNGGKAKKDEPAQAE